MPDLQPELVDVDVSATEGMQASLVEKVDAGAALVYALYHVHGDGLEWLKAAPGSVHRALARAQAAYGVARPSQYGRPAATEDPDA